MAIAGAKLRLEGAFSSRNLTNSVGREMASETALSYKRKPSWKEPSWGFGGRRDLGLYSC